MTSCNEPLVKNISHLSTPPYNDVFQHSLVKSTKRPNNQQIETQVYWALDGWRDKNSRLAQLPNSNTRDATPSSQQNRTSYNDTKVLLQMQELLQKTTLFPQVLLGLCLRTQASQLWYTASATRRKLRVTPATAISSGAPKLNAGCTRLLSHARRLRVARGLVRKRATAVVVYQTGEKRFSSPPPLWPLSHNVQVQRPTRERAMWKQNICTHLYSLH